MSIATIVVGATLAAFLCHMMSSYLFDKSSDNQVACIVICTFSIWIIGENIPITVLAFCSASLGHMASVYLCRRFNLFRAAPSKGGENKNG
jgi:hypothetical protein